MKGRLAIVLLALLLIPAAASADTVFISFAGGGNNLGTSTASFSGVTAFGWYSPTTADPGPGAGYVAANLFQRNDFNDHGLGVCNPTESSDQSSGATCGPGDVNEVDNMSNSEVITLTKPEGTSWVSIQLSSVDCNGTDPCTLPEHGSICFLDNADPNIGSGSCISFSATGGVVEPTFFVPAEFANVAAILIVPGFPADGTHNNDILVAGVTIEVPEPGTLALLGLGLGALAAIRRRKAA